MTYDELSKELEQLCYRDKFRLAQLLIQLARKEEEEQNPKPRQTPAASVDLDTVQYVADRLRKLKPSKKESVINAIGAMFQFRGGISDADTKTMFFELQKRRHIEVAENGRVRYPEV